MNAYEFPFTYVILRISLLNVSKNQRMIYMWINGGVRRSVYKKLRKSSRYRNVLLHVLERGAP